MKQHVLSKELDDTECVALVAQLLGDNRKEAAEARERIILGCLPMVARMAQSFRGYERRGVERGDIIGAGNLALVEAVDNLRAWPVPTLKTWLAFRVKDKMNLAVRQYLNIVSVPKNCGNECLVDVERCEDYDDGEIQRLYLRTFEEEADQGLIRSSAKDELVRLLTRELPYDERMVLHDMFLTEPALTAKDIALQTGINPHKVWVLKDKAIRRLKSSPQGGRILALLHEYLADDVWENTSDAC
jgi:DNA-directed RNA polymerase specialized sigma subunit